VSDGAGLASVADDGVRVGPDLGGSGPFHRADRPQDSASRLLDEARRILNVDRQDEYGNSHDTHRRIAAMWNQIVPQGGRVRPQDVALMMIAVKVIRAAKNPDHKDSWVDIAGYAAIGGSMVEG